jgi:hypothetical protein
MSKVAASYKIILTVIIFLLSGCSSPPRSNDFHKNLLEKNFNEFNEIAKLLTQKGNQYKIVTYRDNQVIFIRQDNTIYSEGKNFRGKFQAFMDKFKIRAIDVEILVQGIAFYLDFITGPNVIRTWKAKGITYVADPKNVPTNLSPDSSRDITGIRYTNVRPQWYIFELYYR